MKKTKRSKPARKRSPLTSSLYSLVKPQLQQRRYTARTTIRHSIGTETTAAVPVYVSRDVKEYWDGLAEMKRHEELASTDTANILM